MIPFKWKPAAWGLKGISFLNAEAEHDLEGEALEYRLLEIQEAGVPTDATLIAKLNLDLKYHHISEYNYQVEMADLTHAKNDERERAFLVIERDFNKISSEEYDRAMVALDFAGDELLLETMHLDFKEGKITENEYAKQVANINGTAWVAGDIKLDGKGKPFMEMDWNEAFIEGLRDKGYSGLNDEEIIGTWWTNVNMHDIEDNSSMIETTVTPLGNGRTEVS